MGADNVFATKWCPKCSFQSHAFFRSRCDGKPDDDSSNKAKNSLSMNGARKWPFLIQFGQRRQHHVKFDSPLCNSTKKRWM